MVCCSWPLWKCNRETSRLWNPGWFSILLSLLAESPTNRDFSWIKTLVDLKSFTQKRRPTRKIFRWKGLHQMRPKLEQPGQGFLRAPKNRKKSFDGIMMRSASVEIFIVCRDDQRELDGFWE
uniref:(northern house mosquito) hypothetical protein n=1 Tax=Culex pipiens TaxID=7175 RepID=A0A8D8K4Z1_CULPI